MPAQEMSSRDKMLAYETQPCQTDDTDRCRALQLQLWAPVCSRLCCAAPAGGAGGGGAAAAVAPQLWLGVERSTGHPPCTPAASAT